MTIQTSSTSSTLCTSTFGEASDNKSETTDIPRLEIRQRKRLRSQTIPSPRYHAESVALARMLKRQQYEDILNYLSQLPPNKQMHWLNKHATYHVPLMFAQAITLLTHDDDSDIEDIACTIHFAELRIKQDLACCGYSDRMQQTVADKIICRKMKEILAVLNSLNSEPVSISFIMHEIDKYRLVLPISLQGFDNNACPPAKDWKVYYRVKTLNTTTESVKKPSKQIRQEVFKKYEKVQEVLNHKKFFSFDQLTPRHYECTKDSCQYLRVNYSPKNIKSTNILGLLFNREESLVEEKDHSIIAHDNGPANALLTLWREKNIQLKKEWLSRNAFSHHPLLLHELGVTTFELEPTFEGFKEAHEYILLGTLRVFLDVSCASDEWLQEVPLIIKANYIGHLINIAEQKCSHLELTKIDWWESYGAQKTYSQRVMKRFIESYDDKKANPNPEWLFSHNWDYNPAEKYSYDQLNNFAFPEWLWKKRREEFLNTLRFLCERN